MTTPAVKNIFDALSPRQRAVAVEVALGGERIEVAEKLGMNPKTFDTHRQAVMKRLGCKNAVELARLALREGIVTNP